MRATLVMESLEAIDKDSLKIFSIGGFQVETDDKKSICFDWDESYSGCDQKGDHLLITTDFKNFNNEDFAETNSENGINAEMITAELLSKSQLVEAFYEAYTDQQEKNFVEFNINSFEFENSLGMICAMSDDNISKFNNNYAQHISNKNYENLYKNLIEPISFV